MTRKLVYLLFVGTFLIGVFVHSLYKPTSFISHSLSNFRNIGSRSKINIDNKQQSSSITSTQMATSNADSELKVFRMKHPGTFDCASFSLTNFIEYSIIVNILWTYPLG